MSDSLPTKYILQSRLKDHSTVLFLPLTEQLTAGCENTFITYLAKEGYVLAPGWDNEELIKFWW